MSPGRASAPDGGGEAAAEETLVTSETGGSRGRAWFRIQPGLRSLVEDASSSANAGSSSYTLSQNDQLDLAVVVLNAVSHSRLAKGLH